LRRAYDLGFDRAALELGRLYGDESSPLYSSAESMRWLRQSALLGSLDAERLIAMNRLVGRGVPADRDAAVAELERLAGIGDVESRYELGRLHESPNDRAPDFEAAAEWYASASERGHADARVAFARLQLAGRGVARDDRAAIHTLELAAASGSVRAARTLARIHADPAFVGYDAARAELWNQRAERLARANRVLGTEGGAAGEAARTVEALGVLRRQAESGNPSAAAALGDRAASRTAQDPVARDEAIRWYRLAAQGGSVPAQTALGRLLAPDRPGVPASAEALLWLRRSADSKDAAALSALGELCTNGNVPGSGRVEGAAYFLAAARAGESGSLKRALEVIDRLSSAETERAYALSRTLYE